MREGCSTHAGHANHVDVPHAMPLIIVVTRDVPLGTDTGVIDDDVKTTKLRDDRVHTSNHRSVVSDIHGNAECILGDARDVEIEDSNGCSALV